MKNIALVSLGFIIFLNSYSAHAFDNKSCSIDMQEIVELIESKHEISIKTLVEEELVCESKQSCLDLAENGNPEANFALGKLYARVSPCNKRYEVYSAEYFEKSCDGGFARACFYLGMYKMQGTGVEKNLTEAASLYESSCNSNVLRACGNLAYLYLIGDGVPKDYSKAADLYKKMCDGGIETACTTLKSLLK